MFVHRLMKCTLTCLTIITQELQHTSGWESNKDIPSAPLGNLLGMHPIVDQEVTSEQEVGGVQILSTRPRVLAFGSTPTQITMYILDTWG